jgi:signal peptidase I
MKEPESGKKEEKSIFHRFLNSEEPVFSVARDVAWILLVVGSVALLLFIFSGTWPAVVAVESESMVPNMNKGDLVFVAAADRYGELQTWNESLSTGYGKFNEYPDLYGNKVYGDVIIYRPNGADSVHPIIHRAVEWYDDGNYSGYLTKGDNNQNIDQMGGIQGIGQIMPVEKEWVIGKAIFSIPFVGYIPLHIFEFAILIIILMVVHELYLGSREKKKK